MNGLVIKNTGSWYGVLVEDGKIINCKVKGNFRIKGIRTTNPVAVGDKVDISINNEGVGFITSIVQRKNYIIRRASNLSKESHIIAANVDQAFLIVSFKDPVTSTTFIDRFLATCEAYSVPAILVINKIDILDKDEMEYAEAVKYLYETVGYKVILTSVKEEKGISELKDLIGDKISLLSGNSGVGKSSIINTIFPDLNIKTAQVSETHHTGMHTTTFSEMYALGNGGYLIDTPGVKGFGTIDFDKTEVAHYFPEIFKISQNCKYNNCTHTHEPGCAVLKALEDSYISESRYNSYLSILEDNTEDKYRKPF